MIPTTQFSSAERAVVKPSATARSLNGVYDVINLTMRLQSLSAPRRNQRAKEQRLVEELRKVEELKKG
jgi:hypothetical protein